MRSEIKWAVAGAAMLVTAACAPVDPGFGEALRRQQIEIEGISALSRAFSSWFHYSHAAEAVRRSKITGARDE